MFTRSCHIQGSKEEKMGAALIKAKGRVSSAVISRPGAAANQWTASAAIIINGFPSEKLEENKKNEKESSRKLLPPVQSKRKRGRWRQTDQGTRVAA